MFVSQILKDKHSGHPLSWIFNKSMTSQQAKILFLKKQLANMLDVRNRICMYILIT